MNETPIAFFLAAIASCLVACDSKNPGNERLVCALFSIVSDRDFVISHETGIDTVRAGLQCSGMIISVEYGLESVPPDLRLAEDQLHNLVGDWESAGYGNYNSPDGVISQRMKVEKPDVKKHYTFIGFHPLSAVHIFHDGTVGNAELSQIVRSMHLYEPRNPPVPFYSPFAPESADQIDNKSS